MSHFKYNNLDELVNLKVYAATAIATFLLLVFTINHSENETKDTRIPYVNVQNGYSISFQ